jgi:hypothetical protein
MIDLKTDMLTTFNAQLDKLRSLIDPTDVGIVHGWTDSGLCVKFGPFPEAFAVSIDNATVFSPGERAPRRVRNGLSAYAGAYKRQVMIQHNIKMLETLIEQLVGEK